MINYFAEMLTRILEKYYPVTSEDHDVYCYGFDILLYTIASTLGLLITGVIANQIVPAVMCIAIFYLNQTVGGGYHARTHLRCYITMSIGMISFLYLIQISSSLELYLFFGLLSIATLLGKPLVLHKNKKYLRSKRKQLTSQSRMVSILELLICIFLYIIKSRLLIYSCTGLLLCALSRIAASKTDIS